MEKGLKAMNGKGNSKILGWALGLGLLGVLGWNLFTWQTHTPEQEARAHLDEILKQKDSILPQALTPPAGLDEAPTPPNHNLNESPEELDHLFDKLHQSLENLGTNSPFESYDVRKVAPSLSFQSPALEVKETPNAYEVRVPLQKAEDEKGVTVQASSHQIQILIQQVHQGFGGHFSSTSSMMKSFPTQSALNLSKIQRKIQGKTLVVTIPKKQVGKDSPQQETPTPDLDEVLPPSIPNNALPEPDSYI